MLDLFRQSVIPPGAAHQSLLELLLMILALIQYPYIGITLGTALCSILLCLIGRGDAADIYTRAGLAVGSLVTFRKSAIILLGIAPMITMLLIHRELLLDSGAPVIVYEAAAAGAATLGLLALSRYRRMTRAREFDFLKTMGTGIAGLFLLLNGAFGLFAAAARMIDPEKWPFIHNALQFGLNWNAIAWFTLFVILSIGVTGAALLFFLFAWEGGRAAPAGGERRFLVYFGAGLTLAGALLSPVVLLLFLVTAPEPALSTGVFASVLCVLIALMILALTAYRILLGFTPALGTALFLLSLLPVLGTVMTGTIASRNALTEQFQALDAKAAKIEEERQAEIAKLLPAKAAKPGREIFEEQCSVCHAFDKKIVGPPYLETVPAYRGDIEALKDYIRNPVKKHDDYPRMPDLGLREAAIDSVAAYLIREVDALRKQ